VDSRQSAIVLVLVVVLVLDSPAPGFPAGKREQEYAKLLEACGGVPKAPSPATDRICEIGSRPVQDVLFDHDGPPWEHGWEVLVPRHKKPNVSVSHSSDPAVGRAIALAANEEFVMNYTVDDKAKQGRTVQCVGQFGTRNSRLYVWVMLVRPGHTEPEDGYLEIDVGGNETKIAHEGTLPEAVIAVSAEPVSGAWGRLTVNIEDAFRRTLGSRGYRLAGMKGFRIRQELTLASISVLE